MGKIIENYALQQIVGEGMYGKVYKAIHLQSKEEFAVKVIPITKFQQYPKLEQCTVNQINILTTIQNSPYIIRYVEMLKTPNNFYFIYEYCNGKTLESLLKQQGKLSQQRALKIFRQLMQAFKVLNKYNVMHRDLKPDNIFFHNGNLKLGDFGFCKTLAKSNDMASTMLGSPIYMAPQVLKGQIYTSKADIWSLGVVLFQMLFGFCPFESNSIAKLISVLQDTQLNLPLQVNNITSGTQNLLKKLLVKDQFKRIDWFQLLQYNISESGAIVEKKNGQNKLQDLKQVLSQRDLLKSTSSNLTTSSNSNSQPEFVFRKKNDTSANNLGNKPITNNPNIKPSTNTKPFQQSKKTSYPYNFLSNNSTPKKPYDDNSKKETSTFSSPPIMKKNSLPVEFMSNMRRKHLLEQHGMCVNGIKTVISFIKSEDPNALIYAYIVFQRVNDRLKKICDNIGLMEIQFQDVMYAINNELKHIERGLSQIKEELQNQGIDILALNDSKTVLRSRYRQKNEINMKLWYDLVQFLINEKAINLSDEMSSSEIRITINNLLA